MTFDESLQQAAKASLNPEMAAYVTCEVCGKNPSVAVHAVPAAGMATARCSDCILARAWPYWILVANTALAGGLHNTMEFWRVMVAETLDWLGKTTGQFDADVTETIDWATAKSSGSPPAEDR